MKFTIGIVLAAFYALLSTLAFRGASGHWALGHSDLGFWWTVIGSLLAIAGVGAVIGTWLHTRPSEH